MNARFLSVLLALPLLLLLCLPAVAEGGATPLVERYEPSFGLLRDTVHVLDSTFLEVRLNEQMIYQHFRNGPTLRFSCSTGDPRIKDGIATREGIYSVQWKARKHMSQQFKVYLNFWMPFDGGIGFHGLQGRSYYKYLGRRSSSHGCVRIANETGARIFPTTPRGTVVWVHSGSPARIVRFADSSMEGLQVLEEIDDDLLDARMAAVLELRAEDPSLARPIALRPGRPFNGGIAVGRVDRLHAASRTLRLLKARTPSMPPRTGSPRPAPQVPDSSRSSEIGRMLAED